MTQDPTQPKKPDFRELGISGTRIFSGLVASETVPQLQGQNAFKTYTGMRNDATGSAILKSIELPIRSARWFVNPSSDDPKDVQLADFIHDNCWDLGDQSMDDILRLALGMLWAGFAWLEIIYSVIDQGPWAGKVGWDRLAFRSQDTRWKWNLDYINGQRKLVSVSQLAPPSYQMVDIPRNKLLLFVHNQTGDNWDGESLFRPSWKSYFYRDSLYRLQAIGLERAYMGIPMATLPLEFGDDLRDLAKQIVETVRTDEQAGIVKPESLTVEMLHNVLNGAEMDKAIMHHNRQMLLASLAQFLDLGSGQAGAYNLSSDHSELFLMAILSEANYTAEVMNLDPGIPTLLKFNFPDIQYANLPKLSHGDIGQRALEGLGRTLQALGQWGFLTPDDATEDRLRQMLDLPERQETIGDRALVDLIQEVFPIQEEYGRQSHAARLQSPLATAAQTAATKAAQPPGEAAMAERHFRMADNRAKLSALMSRRKWSRPTGRPTDEQRMAARATEKFAEALDDFSHRPGQKPMRPSEMIARNRRPYDVRFAEPRKKADPLASKHARQIAARQATSIQRHQTQLAGILRPKAAKP